MTEARNLELSLRFPDPSHVVVTLNSESAGPLDFAAHITGKDREEIRWYLETYASHYTTDVDDAEARRIEAKLPEWGTALFNAAFRHRPAQRLFKRFHKTTGQNRLLSISAEHPTILSLPWELLRDPNGTYLSDENHGISVRRRAIDATRRRAFDRRAKARLRLLFVTSRPSDAPFIDPRAEPQAVMDAVEQHSPGRIEVEFLRPSTFRTLVERLTDKTLPTVDVIHFDGHGAFDTKGSFGDRTQNTGYLLFERESGLTHFVSPEFWHERIGHCDIRLVILSACQSAAIANSEELDRVEEPMGTVAYGLAASGVPAVLAMTHSLLVYTASQLFGEFYRHLIEGRGIGVALDNARHHLIRNPEKHEVQRGPYRARLRVQDWFLPALYQAGHDVALIDSGLEVAPVATVNVTTGLTSTLPQLQKAGFFGRRRELWNIERRFSGGTRRITITGFGGQGKTFLAMEAGRWLLRTGMFERVVFVSYAAFEAVDAVGYAMATIGAAVARSLPDDDAVAATMKEAPTLLILDKLEDLAPGSLMELLSTARTWSECGGSRVLLTSRTPDFHHSAYALSGSLEHLNLTLAGLAEEDALSYFQSLMKQPPAPAIDSPGRDTLLQLFRRVSFHALSIRLLATQLKTRGVEELGARLESLLAEDDDDKTRSFGASLQLSLDKLDDEARAWLAPLGVFRGGAWESALLAITKIPETRWNTLREHLQAAALLEVESLLAESIAVPYLRFHPTLAPWLWSQLPQSEQTTLSAEYRRQYFSLSNGLSVTETNNPQSTRAIARRELPNLLAAAEGALLAGDEFAGPFAVAVAAFLSLSGLEQDAAALMERTVQAGQAGYEAQLVARSTQGEQLWTRGRPHEAEVVFREVLTELADVVSYTRCRALIGMGRCHRTLGRLKLAEESYRTGLAVAAQLEPSDEVKRYQGSLQFELGNVLADGGRYAEARAVYESSLAVVKELGDLRSEGLVNAQFGTLALAERNLPTAVHRYREAIRLFGQLGEPVAESVYRHQLGIVLQEAGQSEEAESHYRESARIAEARGDPIGAAHTWLQLGLLSESAGRLQAAEAWYYKALEGYRTGGDQAGLSRTNGNLAALLYEQPGRLAEARKLAEDALAIKLTLGDGAKQIWTTYNLLAAIAERDNDTTQAKEYRRRGRAAYRNYPGSRPAVTHYARLVADIVASMRGDAVAREAVAREQRTMRQSNSEWARMALVIDQILAGQRDVDTLTANLDALQSLIAEAILEEIGRGRPHSDSKGRGPMDFEIHAPIDLMYLTSVMEQLVDARTPADGRRILEQHPQLLTEDAGFVMDRVLEGARAEGNAAAVRALEQRRALLQRCREVGIDAAFRELKI